MGNENGGLSPSDVALIQGNRGGNCGSNGFDGNGAWWIVLFLIFALGGWGNNNGGGNYGGGYGGGYGGFNDGYAWLSNGQKEIMQNTNTGFNTLHLSNQIDSISNGINSLSSQLCSCCGDMRDTVNQGFYNSEIAANSRQMANMNQNFANQTAMLQGFNQLGSQFADCCCENRLATCQTQNIVQNEGNMTRFADANNTRDIITNATSNTQAILDKLCQLELDGVKAQVEAKNDKIADLQRQLSTADFRASQTAQNAFISQGFANEVDQLYNRLNNCPIPATPVYRKNSDFHLQPKSRLWMQRKFLIK